MWAFLTYILLEVKYVKNSINTKTSVNLSADGGGLLE